MLKLDNYGLGVVKAFEGCMKRDGRMFKPYYDCVGVLTIGWGHTNHHEPKFDQSTRWSQEKCDDVLAKDMELFERHVMKGDPTLGKADGDQFRFDGLTSWSYNTGGPYNSSVWKYVRQRDDKEAVIRLKRWNRAGGQVVKGLVRRRDSEAELYVGNIQEAFKIAGTAVPHLEGARADRRKPRPPVRDVGKVTKRETTAVGVGAGTGAAGTQDKYTGMSYVIMGVGVVIAAVALILLVKKATAFIDDWA